MSTPRRFDDAVVGAGIIGLATARQLARRGRRVVVFERDPRARGASVRNFGMLWPVGQPEGELRDLALRSREDWVEVLRASGLWHDPVGSLHLAYHDDEAAVLAEFADRANGSGFPVDLLDSREARRLAPFVKAKGLKRALFSSAEICVDPREVISALPAWLEREYGARFVFGKTVTGYRRPVVECAGGPWEADRLWVCAGDDLQTLYPDAFEQLGLVPCKLQMLRAEAPEGGVRIGPMLAAGLTLRHYSSFEGCPSLPSLRDRIAAKSPEFDRFGIHVMTSQNGRGEVVIGDSHEYGAEITPFNREEIDALILGYLDTFLDLRLTITARWHGIYVKHPNAKFSVIEPANGVTAITGVGGAGMTLSFGVADRAVQLSLEEGA